MARTSSLQGCSAGLLADTSYHFMKVAEFLAVQ